MAEKFNVKLEGKVALITGSSRGIGEAIAKEFSNEGASVIITYKKNKSLAEELNQKLKNSMIIQLDISNRQNIRNAIQNILKKHERIDILVNNAGINKPTDFEDVTDKDWDEILNTNLKGSFMISQEIFSIMKKQNYGRIINISSISGQYGGPRTVHYAVSKAGLITLGHCLARFGAPYNITCNNIAPGIISTEMTKDEIANVNSSEIFKKILLNRPGTTDELTGIAVFLASEDSSYITGQTINVDGGHLLRT
jgi:3-oxoacyl-[acyl-carrier protein] reductase